MRAKSQAAFDAACERWETLMHSTQGDLKAMALDMLFVVDTLDSNSNLRRVLTDPAEDPEGKAQLVERVFGGRITPEVLDLAKGMARAHWSEEDDFAASIGRIGAIAVLADAEREGVLVQVADEMFAVEQFFNKERELRDAFSDKLRTNEQRIKLVEDVFGGRLLEHTMMILRRMVASARHKGVISSLRTHTRLAAERRDRVVAVVTAPIPLTREQIARIERLMYERYDREVQVHLQIDPQIIGGLKIAVGDDVVDGTIASRLAAVRRDLTT